MAKHVMMAILMIQIPVPIPAIQMEEVVGAVPEAAQAAAEVPAVQAAVVVEQLGAVRVERPAERPAAVAATHSAETEQSIAMKNVMTETLMITTAVQILVQ